MSRGRYGVDAPGLVRSFLVAGLSLILVAFALLRLAGSTTWVPWVAGVLLTLAIYALFMVAYMLWGSLIVKVRERDAILDLIPGLDTRMCSMSAAAGACYWLAQRIG